MDKLLTNAKKCKISLLKLLSEKNMSTKEVGKKLDIPYRTIRGYVGNINKTMHDIFQIEEMIVKGKAGDLRLNPKYRKDFDDYYNRLKLIYLKDTHEFIILVKIAARGDLVITELCDELNFSISYLRQIIRSINDHLNEHNLRIKTKDNKIYLLGEEIRVRLFLFELVSLSYKAYEWPFDFITKEEIIEELSKKSLSQHIDSLSELKKSRVCIIIAITKVRIKEKHYLPELEIEKLEYMELFKNSDGIVTLLTEELKSNYFPIIRKEEILLCNMMIRILVPGYSTRANRYKIGQHLMREDFGSTKFARHMTQVLDRRLQLNMSQVQRVWFVFYISVIHFYQELKGDGFDDIMQIFDFTILREKVHIDNRMQEIENILKYVAVENHQEFMIENKSTIYHVCLLICELVQTTLKSKLNIYLQMTNDIIAEIHLQERLSSIYNTETLEVTANYKRADLIISDEYDKPMNKNAEIFYMKSVNDNNEWLELLQHIWVMILKKREGLIY